ENNGTLVSVRANKAVIFGSGGFTQDGEKSLNYLRGPVFGGCGVPTNTGDFVDIGLALGAKFGNMNHAFWVPSPLEHQLEHPRVTPSKEVWIPYGASRVIVNKYGDRFASEKMVYNEWTQTHFYWDPVESEYKNLVTIMIWDSAVAQNPSEWN